MMERDLNRFRAEAVRSFGDTGTAAVAQPEPEAALRCITRTCFDLLGDRQAACRPGALKEGERQFFVSGIFLVTPGADGHLLVAENGFPPAQHRLRIPIDMGHPGIVYRDRKPHLLGNTDDDFRFRQILKTARMGSVVIAPMIWQGEFLGQLLTAAQARNTLSEPDLEVIIGFAQLAVSVYVAKGGSDFLASLC